MRVSMFDKDVAIVYCAVSWSMAFCVGLPSATHTAQTTKASGCDVTFERNTAHSANENWMHFCGGWKY